jgi:cell wall assembly regulator SMI1
MEHSDFQQIEQDLKVVLPGDYRELLENYPPAIAAARELHLSDNIEWVIGQNQMVREDPASFFGKKAWDPQHLVIGEDGNGNCFYLDLRLPSSPVYRLDHETPDAPDGEPIASNLAAWIPQIQRELEELERNAQSLQSQRRVRKKPWWKFW